MLRLLAPLSFLPLCLGACGTTEPPVALEVCSLGGVSAPATSAPPDAPEPVLDEDGDGYWSDEDCDDADATRSPGLPEECNGVDDNCDGGVDEDADGDGVPPCDEGQGADCDERNPWVHPGADELCVDADCDGVAPTADPAACDGPLTLLERASQLAAQTEQPIHLATAVAAGGDSECPALGLWTPGELPAAPVPTPEEPNPIDPRSGEQTWSSCDSSEAAMVGELALDWQMEAGDPLLLSQHLVGRDVSVRGPTGRAYLDGEVSWDLQDDNAPHRGGRTLDVDASVLLPESGVSALGLSPAVPARLRFRSDLRFAEDFVHHPNPPAWIATTGISAGEACWGTPTSAGEAAWELRWRWANHEPVEGSIVVATEDGTVARVTFPGDARFDGCGWYVVDGVFAGEVCLDAVRLDAGAIVGP